MNKKESPYTDTRQRFMYVRNKNPFFSFRVIILIVVALTVVTIIAASGIIYIPGFSEVFGTNKPRDLGANADLSRFSALLDKENVKLTNQTSGNYLTAPVRYGSAVPMDTTASGEETTSMIQATNNAKGPLKNMQVKLGTNNEMEMSAFLTWNHRGVLSKARFTSKVHFYKAAHQV
jgi:hypothetical protein